ncbi:hypothetical protein BC828DRAFT_362362 [Blastocladiella britannica]|nr:hypothetical protein BC828DRAFT_362362 [Blastocladiella britannica]
MAAPHYAPLPLHDGDAPAIEDNDDHVRLAGMNGDDAESLLAPHRDSAAGGPSNASGHASPAPAAEMSVVNMDDDDEDEDDDEHTRQQKASAAAAAATVVHARTDGVFANLSAKPEAPRPASSAGGAPAPREMPPSYEAAVTDPAPTYWDTTVFTASIDDGEVLVEGMPVGSLMTVLLSTLASFAFQFVGFMLTYLLATSHAGRSGAKVGLGLTLMQYGTFLRTRVELIEDGNPFADEDFNASLPPDTTPEEAAAILDRTEWVAFILMFTGWIVIVKAMVDYSKARKLRALVLASPEALIA